jgi:tripartite-type tricarboxylate transporter receptor subunit TctC
MKFPCFVAASLALAICCATGAYAQAGADYPNRAVRIVVPVAAGGNVDIIARALAEQLANSTGQPHLVENRPGASSLLGTQLVAKAPADGYTLLAISNTYVSAPAIVANPGYDPVADFIPVSLTCRIPMVLVTATAASAQTVQELIAQAKAKPGTLSYATSGNGSTGHIAGELFMRAAGIKLLHVPYKGNAQSLVDLVGGQVGMMFDQVSTSLPQIQSGKLRPLGVTTLKRSAVLPAVPTLDEAGLRGYDDVTFNAIMAPAGTPREVVAKLHAEIAKAWRSPALQKRFGERGIELAASASPDEFAAWVKGEVARYAKLAREAGIKAD